MKLKDINLYLQKLYNEIPELPEKRFIQAAYKKLTRTLASEFDPEEDVSAADIENLQITPHMKKKLCEIIKKRPLKISPLLNDLNDIPGIGPQKIRELQEMGLKSVKQLKQKKFFEKLGKSAQMFIEKEPERKIPHEIISEIEHQISSKWDTTIVGSYRRNAPFSRDIDIMLISDKKDELKEYVSFLKSRVKLFQYAAGPDKASFLIEHKSKYYKFDVFRTPKKYKWAMLLYSTGSKEFNIRMRGIAKKNGLRLNQEGLFKNGSRIDINSEEGYFKVLGIKFIKPEERK